MYLTSYICVPYWPRVSLEVGVGVWQLARREDTWYLLWSLESGWQWVSCAAMKGIKKSCLVTSCGEQVHWLACFGNMRVPLEHFDGVEHVIWNLYLLCLIMYGVWYSAGQSVTVACLFHLSNCPLMTCQWRRRASGHGHDLTLLFYPEYKQATVIVIRRNSCCSDGFFAWWWIRCFSFNTPKYPYHKKTSKMVLAFLTILGGITGK